MNTFEKLLKTMRKRLHFFYHQEKTNLKIMYSFKLTFYLTFVVYNLYLLARGLPRAVYDKEEKFLILEFVFDCIIMILYNISRIVFSFYSTENINLKIYLYMLMYGHQIDHHFHKMSLFISQNS